MAEITFTNPAYLWFLVSIPLMVATHFYLLRHAHKKAMKFANFETLRRVTGERLLTKNIPVLINRVVILILVVCGVSGATLWYYGESNQNNFIIAIDVSASMSAEDIFPTRLDAAKENAIKFIDMLDSDTRIGLVTFSGVPFIEQLPTRSRYEIKNSLEEIDIVQAGGTDIPGAIVTSTNLLADSEKGKTIILISDGSSTIGAFLDDAVDRSVAYAMDNHVLIHTVGTGKMDTQPIGYLPEYYNISAVYNEKTLVEISNSTGGRYYHAVDNQKLVDAFKAIAEDSRRTLLRTDLTPGLMLISMILLFVEWGLINTKFRRKP